MRRWYRITLLAALVGFAALLFLGLFWLMQMDPQTRDQNSSFVGVLLSALGMLASATIWVLVRTRPTRTSSEASNERLLVNQLATRLQRDWTDRARQRRILQDPLPVRWQLADPEKGSAAAPAAAVLASTPRFRRPIAGVDQVGLAELEYGGGRDELHQIYGGLSTGRIIVIGEPGAGKSSAAILLLLDALEHRDHISAQQNESNRNAEAASWEKIPVPVLYTLHGWDPRPTAGESTATEFVADKLVTDFPGLLTRETAIRLLTAGRLSVFFDGLDEISENLRPHVFKALNDAPFRVVLLSRTAEASAAARSGTLLGAVAIELLPITPDRASAYLLSSVPIRDSWLRVADRIRNGLPSRNGETSDAVTEALTRPLLLTLARETYLSRISGDSPDAWQPDIDELLDRGRFPTVDTIEHHLLDQVIEIAYAQRGGYRNYTVEQARRTLTYLAKKGSDLDTRDFAWWEVPGWFGMQAATPSRTTVTPRDILDAIGVGLTFGFASGYAGFLLGSLIGLIVAIISPASTITGVEFGFQAGTSLGFSAGFVVGIILGLSFAVERNLESDDRPTGPMLLWRQDRLSFILQTTVFISYNGIATILAIALFAGISESIARDAADWISSGFDDLFGGWFVAWFISDNFPADLTIWFTCGIAGGIIGSLIGNIAVGPTSGPAGAFSLYFSRRHLYRIGRFGRICHGASIIILITGVIATLVGFSSPALWLVAPVGVVGSTITSLSEGTLSPWLAATVLGRRMARKVGTPAKLMLFLSDAHSRGVLRTVGPVYQFRHATLQDLLAKSSAADS